MTQQTQVFKADREAEAILAASHHHQKPISCLKMERVLDDQEDGYAIQVVAIADEDDGVALYQTELEPLYAMINDLMIGLDQKAELSHSIDDQVLTLNIDGSGLDVFLGHHAELLGDLQFLVARFFKSLFPNLLLDIRCDVNHFRAKREARLVEMVDEVATRLTSVGDSEILRPLNAYERRFVHMHFQHHSSIKTDSLGDGQMKRIRLTYAPELPSDDE